MSENFKKFINVVKLLFGVVAAGGIAFPAELPGAVDATLWGVFAILSAILHWDTIKAESK